MGRPNSVTENTLVLTLSLCSAPRSDVQFALQVLVYERLSDRHPCNNYV